METLNGSYSHEITLDKFADITTVTSLKSSLSSIFHSSLPKIKQLKLPPDAHLEDFSIDQTRGTDEECPKIILKNFQKHYLDLGQWPEIPARVLSSFKARYKVLKNKLAQCKEEKQITQNLINKYKAGEIPCKSCEIVKKAGIASKLALEESIMLSNMLLQELKRVDSSHQA